MSNGLHGERDAAELEQRDWVSVLRNDYCHREIDPLLKRIADILKHQRLELSLIIGCWEIDVLPGREVALTIHHSTPVRAYLHLMLPAARLWLKMVV
jgi:hypothetical protein